MLGYLVPSYLLAVVGGILNTQQVVVGPSVKITVLSTNMAVSCIPRSALTAEHRVTVDSQVNAICIFMAVMASILTRITRFAHLEGNHENSETESCFPSDNRDSQLMIMLYLLPAFWQLLAQLPSQRAEGQRTVLGRADSCNLVLCSHTGGLHYECGRHQELLCTHQRLCK